MGGFLASALASRTEATFCFPDADADADSDWACSKDIEVLALT